MKVLINKVKVLNNNIYIDLNIDGKPYDFTFIYERFKFQGKENMELIDPPSDFWKKVKLDSSKIKPFFETIKKILDGSSEIELPIEIKDEEDI